LVGAAGHALRDCNCLREIAEVVETRRASVNFMVVCVC